MNKIIEYQIAKGTGDYKDLVKDVNELIKAGFEPMGGVSTCGAGDAVSYTQAMIKRSTSDKQPIPAQACKKSSTY
jgi:hypothetical protein